MNTRNSSEYPRTPEIAIAGKILLEHWEFVWNAGHADSCAAPEPCLSVAFLERVIAS